MYALCLTEIARKLGFQNRLGYTSVWTGFTDYYPSPNIPEGFQRGKTLWDWMNLLIVPVVLAGGAFFLSRATRRTTDSRRASPRSGARNVS